MSVQTFINQIGPLIQAEAKKRGYTVCSTTIAQAIIESRYGESGLAKYHNYFGLKCGSKWKGASVNMKTKEEYKVGTLTTITSNFRAYSSMEEGVKGYYDFISTTRYSNLKKAYNYIQFAEMLKQDGYATSSSYVSTLCNTVVKYNLIDFDSGNIATISKPITEAYPTLKQGSKGEFVKHVQLYLTLLGYPVGKVDSVYGPQTAICVELFQIDKHLNQTGVWDMDCWNTVLGNKK